MQREVVSPVSSEKQSEDRLGQVREGADVYDRLGKMIGKVVGIYGGTADGEPAAPTRLAMVSPVPTQATVIRPTARLEKVPEFDDVLDPKLEIPQEIRERLEHDGFIRIDAGFLKHHRYALGGQIERVEDDRVILDVVADDLLKY